MDVTATLFIQILTFGSLVWFVQRFLWGPLTQAMDSRKAAIADGIAAGEHGKHQQQLAEKRAIEVIQEARGKANEIINQAQKRGGEIVEEAKATAKIENSRLIAGAKAEITQEIAQVKEQLKQQVSALAIAGAEKILKKEIDLNAHKSILDDVVNKL